MIIGTGVDITEVQRLKRAVEKWGNTFLDKIFTQEELVNARKRTPFYQHLAGRFAAKEAVFKALGNKLLSWHDLEIINDPEGKPYCKVLNNKGKGATVHLSISHVKTYAVASAVIEKTS